MTDEPYTLREVHNHQDVIDLTRLLRESGQLQSDPLGAAIRTRPDRLALASRGEVFLIPLDDKLVQAALSAAVMGGNPPRLVVRDAETFLVRATKYMTEHGDLDSFRRLADLVVGDLEECGRCIDQPVLPTKSFKNPADDAYDARILEPSLSYECFSPETRVLMADLTWKPIGELSPGDQILACDEFAEAQNRQRRWRISNVTDVQTKKATLREYILEDGTHLRATPDHPVLAYSGNSFNRVWRSIASVERTHGRLCRTAPSPWKSIDSWQAGWLAGMFDGEGSLPVRRVESQRPGQWLLTVCQKEGLLLRQLRTALEQWEFSFREFVNRPAKTLLIQGGIGEILRFLGIFRPARLLEKARRKFSTGETPCCQTKPVKIQSSWGLGVQDVVDITTDTGTFIAEGLVVHNCPKFYYSISLPWARLRAEYRLFGEKKVDWWLSFPELYLRVLAYMTADPTLLWAFNQERDPLETVSTLLKAPPETVEPLLIWQALGRTVQVVAEVFPKVADTLPDNLPEWGRKLDRALPSLVGGISNMMHTYQERRVASTLYGRKMRGGRHPAYAPYFTIWGSVEDILRVAAVTFWQNGKSRGIFIGDVDMDPLARLNRVRGTAPTLTTMEELIYNMNNWAFLGEPLRSQPKLSPTFVIAEK